MRILERLWLRVTFRRRPRLSNPFDRTRPHYGGLSETELGWVDAIRPLFDERYYLHTHPDVRHQPLSAAAHYVTSGHRAAFDPAPWFSEAGYLAIHDDVREAGLPAFVHYAIYGRYEGRRVVPVENTGPPTEGLR